MNYVVLMETIVKIIAIICGVGLPISIVWLDNRKKINETNQRTQIVLSALEKNPQMDVEELLKKMAPQKKLLKEKLLTKLLWGGITAFLGTALIGFCVVQDFIGGMPIAALQQFSFIGVIFLAIGIAFLVNYFVGKKMLIKEIEAEQKKLLEQA